MHRVACVCALILFLAVPAHAQPDIPSAGFLAFDVFGALATHVGSGAASAATEDQRERFNGWEVGASFKPRPWFGVTGTVGRTWSADTRLMHYLAGPRFSTSYSDNYYAVRGFAHVLLGVGSASATAMPSESGFEMAVGGGLDVWYVVRVQFDYLRLPHAPMSTAGNALNRNQVRGVIGAVIPLCFGGCRRDVDGIDLSK